MHYKIYYIYSLVSKFPLPRFFGRGRDGMEMVGGGCRVGSIWLPSFPVFKSNKMVHSIRKVVTTILVQSAHNLVRSGRRNLTIFVSHSELSDVFLWAIAKFLTLKLEHCLTLKRIIFTMYSSNLCC